MRALVIGGSGQIGTWLLHTLSEHGHEAVGTFATVPYPGLVQFDSARTDEAADLLNRARPEVVFYPAGFTWVDECERDHARARAANFDQPLHLARLAAKTGALFVYFSTDYVFDGAAGPYHESDPPAPLSVYGETKLAPERALDNELGDRQLTLRTAWVYGPERQGKNFAYQLVRALSRGNPLTCPSDQISSPSYGPDVALAAVLLAEQRCAGLWHVAGPEVVDRVAFARSLARGFGLNADLIEGKPTRELNQVAARPLQGGLLTHKLDAAGLIAMRPVAAAVEDFRSRLARDPEGLRDPFAATS